MNKKKVLITGITGMVGSHLLDYILENSKLDVYGLIRWRSSLENINHHLPLINKNKRIFLEYGDLRDNIVIDGIVKKIKPDLVFHLAAQSFPLISFESPIETYQTNIIGTEILLRALKNHQPHSKILVCSSSEVFGKVPSEQIPIKEDCSFHPASPYAISKVGTDLIARHYSEAYNMLIVSTRMFTHTGPRRGDVFAESSFAKQIAMIERGMIEPTIKTGNLDSLRTWADVRDAVRAYYMLLVNNPRKGEYYNIGGDYTCKIGEMLDFLISQSTYKNIKIIQDKNRLRPVDADLQIPDLNKFKSHTGWEPKITFQETMIDLLNYWREKVKEKNFLDR